MNTLIDILVMLCKRKDLNCIQLASIIFLTPNPSREQRRWVKEIRLLVIYNAHPKFIAKLITQS